MPKGLIFAVCGLLLLAIAPLPYGYYELLRFVVCGTFAYLVYLSVKQQVFWHTPVFAVVAVLFNPIFPIYLDKAIWMGIDAGSAAVLFVLGRRYMES